MYDYGACGGFDDLRPIFSEYQRHVGRRQVLLSVPHLSGARQVVLLRSNVYTESAGHCLFLTTFLARQKPNNQASNTFMESRELWPQTRVTCSIRRCRQRVAYRACKDAFLAQGSPANGLRQQTAVHANVLTQDSHVIAPSYSFTCFLRTLRKTS